MRLAICGGELFVCDMMRNCIQVFSLTGELLRSIRGEWRRPNGLACVRDRLYLTEDYNPSWETNEDERPEGYSPEMGRRVFVMSPAGEAIQTYDLELDAGQMSRADAMAVFGENLVLKVHEVPQLIALKGL